MVHHMGNVQPISALKLEELIKMDGGKGDGHVALSHTETWKNPFVPPSPNCPPCLVWHRSSTDPDESQAWFGGYHGPGTIPNSHFECGHPFLKVKRA